MITVATDGAAGLDGGWVGGGRGQGQARVWVGYARLGPGRGWGSPPTVATEDIAHADSRLAQWKARGVPRAGCRPRRRGRLGTRGRAR